MLYDIVSQTDAGFDAGVRLRPPIDPTEKAKNVNADGHTLYADYGKDGALEWREPARLSETGQRRHGVGPIIEQMERQQQREKYRRELATLEQPWAGCGATIRVTRAGGRLVTVTIDGSDKSYELEEIRPDPALSPDVLALWTEIRRRAGRLLVLAHELGDAR